jgi:hypothetical protein
MGTTQSLPQTAEEETISLLTLCVTAIGTLLLGALLALLIMRIFTQPNHSGSLSP